MTGSLFVSPEDRMTIENQRAPKSIDIEVDGTLRTITMTFGLLTQLSAQVGTAGDIQLAVIDPLIGYGLINTALTERDNAGKVTKEVDITVGDIIDEETYEEILSWIVQHVMLFFVRRSRAFAKGTRNLGGDLKELKLLNKDVDGLLN